MADYIKREDALNACYGMCDCRDDCVDEIKKLPAADVVEVVRCKDCCYWQDIGVEGICNLHSGHKEVFGEDATYTQYHCRNWFCADGSVSRNDIDWLNIECPECGAKNAGGFYLRHKNGKDVEIVGCYRCICEVARWEYGI